MSTRYVMALRLNTIEDQKFKIVPHENVFVSCGLCLEPVTRFLVALFYYFHDFMFVSG